MSEPGKHSMDERDFEEYLSRRSALSRRYREQQALDVPPELDRRVVEQARAAVGSKRTPHRWNDRSTGRWAGRWVGWSAPLAAAASIMLVAVIVFDRDVRETAGIASDHASTEVAADQLASAPVAEQPAPVSAPQQEAARNEDESPVAAPPAAPLTRMAKSQEPTRASAPAPEREVRAESAREPVRQAAAESAATATDTDEPRHAAEAERRAVAPIAFVGRAAPAVVPPQLEPEEWLERIRELRAAGENEAADEEWQRFLDTYPDYPVKQTDPARARE